VPRFRSNATFRSVHSRNDPRNEFSIPPPPEESERCQARPAAARRGFREDVLCASLANTVVEFQGQVVAVCRMHEATYKRWGAHAEKNAAELWEWPATPTTHATSETGSEGP
jgi:hypothetical protein